MFAIRARHGFDGEAFLDGGATVLVADGRIAGVETAAYAVPADVEVYDHGEATVLPGLIDTHVHLVGDSGPGALDRVAGYGDDEIDAVVTTALQQQLASGVTTVRDLGDRDFVVVSRRDAQRRSDDAMPHILASGPPITISGGHCASFGTTVAGIGAMRRAVRTRVDQAVDAVKVMASGGVMTAGTDLFAPQFSSDELRVVVDIAHQAGLPVIAHAHPAAAIRMCMDVGVDGLEHVSYLERPAADLPEGVAALTSFGATEEELARLATSGIAVCPTLGGFSKRMARLVPPAIKRIVAASGLTLEEVVELRRALIRRMHDAGVRLVGGMDAGISPPKAHGNYAESVVDMSEVMPASRALAASTSIAAEAVGLAGRKGRLAPGYDADLLVVAADLATEVTSLRQVRQVVLRGVVVSDELDLA